MGSVGLGLIALGCILGVVVFSSLFSHLSYMSIDRLTMGRDVRVRRTNLGPGLSEANHNLMVVAAQGPP